MSLKPLIFLDIDGVLNNLSFNPVANSYAFERVNVGYFNYLLGRMDANVVISSAWR